MINRDVQDIIAGALLLALGLAIASYAYTSYNLGTLQRMGPGMFPFGLGSILAALGLLILVPGFFRQAPPLEFSLRKPLFVLLGIASFALSIRTLGMIPAIALLTGLSSLADERLRPLSVLGLAVGLNLLAWLVFVVGLGLRLPLLRWPL